MGLLRDSLAVRYLHDAPPGQRKNLLTAVAVNRISRLPVAASAEYGEPVTDIYGLEPAAQTVREVLSQDRSMYAWLARTAMVALDAALARADGSWFETLEVATASVGFGRGNVLHADLRARLPDDVVERVVLLHQYCMNIFWAVARPEFEDKQRDRRLYTQMFEDPDPRTALTAHDVAAWACVVLGRLSNRGVLPPLWYSAPVYARLTRLTEPGWYPNPYNYGDLVRGEPDFQRYWDGGDWTDQVRRLVRGRWSQERHSLRTVPDN
jgi:hypothetical protein